MHELKNAKYLTVDDEDPFNLAQDWLQQCAADLTCMAAGGSDTGSSLSTFASLWADFLAIGGFLGAGYGYAITTLEGAAATLALSEALALYGFLGMTAVTVGLGTWILGTIIYDSVGNWLWITYAP